MHPESRQPAPSQRQLHSLSLPPRQLCFKLAHYGTFGEDYGPDLAFWAACRRLEPFRPAACRPAAALAVLAADQ